MRNGSDSLSEWTIVDLLNRFGDVYFEATRNNCGAVFDVIPRWLESDLRKSLYVERNRIAAEIIRRTKLARDAK